MYCAYISMTFRLLIVFIYCKLKKEELSLLSLVNHMSVRALSQAMDASQLRQHVINHNIANVDTPYYKAKRVRFEDVLLQELNKASGFKGRVTDPRHIPIGRPGQGAVTPEVTVETGTKMNNNGNNVDIDAEMALLAKNGLWYQALAQSLNHEFRQLRHVITEGRG